MTRNTTYLLLGGLIVACGVLGYFLWQESQTNTLDINIGGAGVSVDTD